MQIKSVDVRFHHPFNCIVVGPSGCGKSTFVSTLLKRREEFIDQDFDFIFIFIGTSLVENKILAQLEDAIPDKVSIVSLKEIYSDEKQFEVLFPKHFMALIASKQGQRGCIVFDDLMTQLANCGLLVDLFTKIGSHGNLTIIHITQNLFHKGGGKHATDNVTIYRNTRVLVLFKTPLDNSILSTIASRRGGNTKRLVNMFSNILDDFRYLIIRGDFETDPSLKFTSDIFNTEPIPHQKSFSLIKYPQGKTKTKN